MRKFLFVFIIIFCVLGLLLILGDLFSGSKYSPPPPSALTIPPETLDTAQKALDLLVKLDFDNLQMYYSEAMKQESSIEQSKKLWSDFFNATGPYLSTLNTRNEKAGFNDKIIFTCQFRRRPVYIKITLNPSREIEQLTGQLLH